MVIPPQRLDKGVLRHLVESFITREGTDYGEVELSLREKVDNLMPAVLAGKVLIVFDEATNTVNLLSQEDYRTREGGPHEAGAH